ncbi:MAG: hypothetical protein K6C14_08445, partial [Eubacterium sp.]|nr:hypothetical protein [Eubacterium sp.]
MKRLISVILSLVIIASSLTVGAFSAFASTVDENCVKILLVGNSYTYFNGMPQILSRLCEKTGESAMVVSFTKGGADAKLILNETLPYQAWYNGDRIEKGSGNLMENARKDIGNIGRGGSWDYIVLQNNADASETGMGDIYILGLLRGMLEDNRNFILNSNYWINSLKKDRHNEHLAVCKATGCSLIDTRGIFAQYHNVFKNRVWMRDLSIRDSRNHPSVKGAYIFALAIYAKLFGIERLADSFNCENMIELYNSDGGDVSEFLNVAAFPNDYTEPVSIDRTTASGLQFLVRDYAESYIGEPL